MNLSGKARLLLRFTVVVSALSMSANVSGATVYKWVDEDGRVTYRDKPPPDDSGGEVEKKSLDPDSNVIQYEAPEPAKTAPATGGAGANEADSKDQTGKDNDGGLSDHLIHDDETQRLEKEAYDKLDDEAKKQLELEKEQLLEQQRLEEEARRQEIDRHNNRLRP